MRKLKEVFETDGWLQGYHHNPATNRRCMVGGLMAICKSVQERERLEDIVWEIISEQYPDYVPSFYVGNNFDDNPADEKIPWWNDDPDRKIEEVILIAEKFDLRMEERGI